MIRHGLWRRELAVPLQSIQAELNRLFEEYWQAPGVGGVGGVGSAETSNSPSSEATDLGAAVWAPAIDLWESPQVFTLVVDLPGVDPGSIDLSLTGNVLSVRGDRPTDNPNRNPEGDGKSRVKERASGSFHRQITLVDEVDFDRVEAQSVHGVLTVRLPKRNTAQPRTIPIQSPKS